MRCFSKEHEDKNPSMSYFVPGKICKCFACGEKYDIFKLVGEEYGIEDFKEIIYENCYYIDKTMYIEDLIKKGKLEGIIISPGPKSPKDCGLCNEIVKQFYKKVAIFGVCLGHQIIGHVFGAEVKKGKSPVHGKVHKIKNSGKNIFKNLPKEFNVTRYHSLVVEKEKLLNDFNIEAETDDGVLMALSHKIYPLYLSLIHI